jgi:hypothetical protein
MCENPEMYEPMAVSGRITQRLTWIKAVATMTPEPKYFVIKNAKAGTCMRFVLAAAIGSSTPV